MKTSKIFSYFLLVKLLAMTDKLILWKHNFTSGMLIGRGCSACSVDVKIMIIHAEQRGVFMSQSVTRVSGKIGS